MKGTILALLIFLVLGIFCWHVVISGDDVSIIMASRHDESEDEGDTRCFERPRGRPRKDVETASMRTKRRRIDEVFAVGGSPNRASQGPSADIELDASRSPPSEGSTIRDDASAWDCIGDLPNLTGEDQLADLCDRHEPGEGAGDLGTTNNFLNLAISDSVQAQDDEVMGRHELDAPRDNSEMDVNNDWVDTMDLGPLHYDCDLCISCICVNCNECIHSVDGDCSHCFSCLSDLDGVISDSEMSDGNIENSESSSESEDEVVVSGEEALNDRIRADLVNVCLRNNLNHVAIDDLLGFLRKYNVGQLPKSAKTLLKTPKQVTLRDVPPGQYWHNGITKHLIKYATLNPDVSIIDVTISSDGVPLFNSSNISFWPLTCSFNNDKAVHVIGLYLGEKKPDDPNEYMRDFVEEIKPLCQEGLQVEGRVVSVGVSKGIFDAVARSWVLCVMGCNAKSGCFKCTVEGETEDHRTYFADLQAPLRTDESFVTMRQRHYHKTQTILSNIPRFGCVTSVPLDYMHLILLGVMRKLMYMWIGGPLNVRQGSAVVNAMSTELMNLVGWIPLEFARKTRSLQYVKRFKATEYRVILLYVGVTVFRLLPRRLYEHFLSFHVVMTIFADPVFCKLHLKYAKELSVYFVETFKELYGRQYVSHNVHSMIHLHDDVEKFGPVDNFSAFQFENFYQKLTKLVRKGDRPLQQIAKRYKEFETSVLEKSPTVKARSVGGRYSGGVLMEGCTNPQFNSFFLQGGLELNLSEANRCCLINDSTVVLVDNFATDVHGNTVVIGKEFLKLEDAYDFPCSSSTFNISYAYKLSKRKVWLASGITRKCFRLPWKNGFIILPMHHLP